MPKRTRAPAHRKSQGEEIIGVFVGFVVAYLAAESLLRPFVHPVHWGVAVLGGLVGYVGGVVWYRRGPSRPRR